MESSTALAGQDGDPGTGAEAEFGEALADGCADVAARNEESAFAAFSAFSEEYSRTFAWLWDQGLNLRLPRALEISGRCRCRLDGLRRRRLLPPVLPPGVANLGLEKFPAHMLLWQTLTGIEESAHRGGKFPQPIAERGRRRFTFARVSAPSTESQQLAVAPQMRLDGGPPGGLSAF